MVIHQLITKGTDVVLQWISSHVSVSGNEHADKADKQAAKGVGATKINLKPSRAVWGQWVEEFAMTLILPPRADAACASPRCPPTSRAQFIALDVMSGER